MPIARLAALIVSLTFMALPLAAAQQVEVHLRSGVVVVGEVVSDDPDKLVIKSTSVAKSGKAMSITLPYKRADIAKVVKLADPEELYRSKSVAAMSAADHLALALWCRENNLNDQSVVHAKKAVELDATQEIALKMLSDLDLALIDGMWVKESEALAAQGKVRYQGKVMTIAEADALKAAAQKDAAAAGAQKAADDKENSLAAIDKQIAEVKKRPAEIDAALQKANNDLAAAQGLAQKVPAAKAALDAAQQNLDQARTANQNQPAGAGVNAGTNLQPLTQAVENAQKALAAARREAGGADAMAAQAKAKITALTNEKKSLEKKLENLTARREAAVKALEQAKAAAGKTTP
jgi:chemotaxis protein MotB